MDDETEGEQPPATEGNDNGEEGQEDEEPQAILSVIIEEDGPTTRKIQTDFTIPSKGLEAAAMAAALGVKVAPVRPGPPPFQPCGDMPLPPGADPGQWGFPEFCPRKMLRYAEAAAAVAAAAEAGPENETALPGEAVDTLFDEEGEEAADEAEPASEAQAHEGSPINLSVLSAEGGIVTLGEEVIERDLSSVGDEEEVEASPGEETAEEVEASPGEETTQPVVEIVVLGEEVIERDLSSVGDAEGVEASPGEETAEVGQPPGEEAAELERSSSSDVYMEAIGMEEHEEWFSDEDLQVESSNMFRTIDDSSVKLQGAGQMTQATAPVLWKIEQEIAVVRQKLSEMQQKITALDLADYSAAAKPAAAVPPVRRKCVCDPQKRAGLPAAPVPTAAAPPPAGPTKMADTGERAGAVFHSAPCVQGQSLSNVAHDLRPFPQQFPQQLSQQFPQQIPQQIPQIGGGVDIYIASRSGNTNAVTSINPANFQQYAEKPVLKAFGSPDVDVYVVTDKITTPGYSGHSGQS